MNKITINGVTHQVSGNNISVKNGVVMVDGVVVTDKISGDITVKFEGSIANLKAENVKVFGDVFGSVDTTSLEVDGDINANVNATSIEINGNIGGDVDATSVEINGDISGNVNATSVTKNVNGFKFLNKLFKSLK
jgi:cytoskeletal protein CcmA (bactofilin family)